MSKHTLTFTFARDDWDRIVQALRNDAFYMTQMSQRAHEKGAQDYATMCWEETVILNSLAETIDYKLPE